MDLHRRRRIEQRAYALWEAEGHPHGRHEEHWRRAAGEIEAEDTAGGTTRRAPRQVARRGAEKSEHRSPPRRGKTSGNLNSARP
jgi:Protein of unknown function (DUF2934)